MQPHSTCVCMYVCMCVCMYVCMCVCVYVHMYVFIILHLSTVNYITQPVNVPQDISQSPGIVLDHMSYNYNQVPRVLPPINPQHHELPTYNHIKAVEHPVQSLPLYTPNYEAWSTFQRTQETREYKDSRYISDQEIHLAAMEGVKTSYLKKLV